MKIGIIAAMNVELQTILDKMSQVKSVCEQSQTGQTLYRGQIGSVEVILMECGIGKVNAAIGTQALLDRFQLDLLINTGVAGSLAAEVGHLDLVIGDLITYWDVRAKQLAGTFPYQAWFSADADWVKRFADAAPQAFVGRIVTGDGFVAEKQQKAQLRADYQALCVEMEGAAIAQAAFVNQVPFVMLRCISDLAADATGADYAAYEKLAAQKVADLLVQVLVDF